MHKKINPIAFLIVLLSTTSLFSQTLNIVGPTTATQGGFSHFSLTYPNGNSAFSYTHWYVDQGIIVDSDYNTIDNVLAIDILWDWDGIQDIGVQFSDPYYNEYYDNHTVTVSPGTPPPPPPTAPENPSFPIVLDAGCGQITLPTLQRTGTPPVGDTWYWQGQVYDGTSTSLGSGATFTANQGSGSYYIRAVNSNGIWSNESKSVFVQIITPTTWYADMDLDGFGDPNAPTITSCTKPVAYTINNTDLCPTQSGSNNGCPTNTIDNENYIHTIVPKIAVTDVSQITQNSNKTESITYFDGLGRPMQSIGIRAGGLNNEDIITHIEYDAFGRQTKDYLPYAIPSENGSYKTGEIDLVTINFYNTSTYNNTLNPYSEKEIEASPLNRVLKQAAPGTDWALGSGHEIKMEYQTNAASDAVKLFVFTLNVINGVYTPSPLSLSPSNAGNYPAGELYKTITYDENATTPLSESNGSTVEFKNKLGQVVLKRTYGIVGTGTTNENHDTYYVYDDYGNLTFVIPPLVTNATDATQLGELCYQYKYDSRNRLVEKKLPGKQWEFIVYDKLDRVVATGPAMSPFSDDTRYGWLITKYDVFSRPVYTGWITAQPATTAGRKILQDAQNSATVFNESKSTSGTIDGIFAYYSNVVAPTTLKLLTVNYYDNYTLPNCPAIPATIESQIVLTATKNLPTGSWARATTIRSSGKGETTTTFYDAKARPIRSYLINYLGGYTYTDTYLDFLGVPQNTKTYHKRISTDTELKTTEVFTYSAQGRLLTHTHQIGTSGAIQLLASNKYDKLGQLTSKEVGNTLATPIQKVDYAYNIRGWMTGINDVSNLQQGSDPKDLFSFKINYNSVENCTNYTGKALYNGNISETYWRTNTDNIARKYGYKYDDLNRLKESIYQKANTINPSLTTVTNKFDENIKYDKNGNIISLVRNGDPSDTNTAPAYPIDVLTYNYPLNTNRLMSVSDAPATATSGFKDGNLVGEDYSYDSNGNMTIDKNKGITAIVYNHLNLPTKITFGTTGNIVYIYNALGQKIEKTVTQGTTVTKTNYLGGYQYNGVGATTPSLQFFPTAEGYVTKTGTAYSYVFNYTDHLGNVRLSYGLKNNVLTVIDESNYYPFGLKHSGYNPIAPVSDYKYKYNGKELQDELGLNMYDFGARNYDPALGRWMNVDPLAEKSRRFSPYAYALDNPVYFIDPDGMSSESNYGRIDEEKEAEIRKDNKAFAQWLQNGGSSDDSGSESNSSGPGDPPTTSSIADFIKSLFKVFPQSEEEAEQSSTDRDFFMKVTDYWNEGNITMLGYLSTIMTLPISAGEVTIAKGISVIGPRATYRQFAKEIGANYLKVTDATWTWVKNEKYLAGIVKRGDDVIFAGKFNPNLLDKTSVLAKEIKYLESRGYQWTSDFTKMVLKK